MALGEKISGDNGHIYVLVGDGEINEGTTWESALLAHHHGLNNLTCIVDHNHSTDRALGVDPIGRKFIAFGWSTLEVDGHDVSALSSALRVESDRPTAIIARTVKGKGVAPMENAPAWHHGAPTSEQLDEMLRSMR
jgi:transketolase